MKTLLMTPWTFHSGTISCSPMWKEAIVPYSELKRWSDSYTSAHKTEGGLISVNFSFSCFVYRQIHSSANVKNIWQMFKELEKYTLYYITILNL